MGEMYNAIGPGEAPTTKMPAGLYDTNMSGGPSLEEELNIDRNTMETMKSLYQAKERAIELEDFDEAKRIKDTIERLKTVAGHIAQLEERKRMAIQKEDYEAAKIIKTEIEKMKNTVMNPGFRGPSFPP